MLLSNLTLPSKVNAPDTNAVWSPNVAFLIMIGMSTLSNFLPI